MEFQQKCLETACRALDRSQLLTEFVQRIQGYVRCEAVGIRVLDDTGHIPYQAYSGFSRAFYESESRLSLHKDECMCIAIIRGGVDANLPYFTKKGSFQINGTSRFLASIAPEDLGATRNACNAHGYESVALIPIPIGRKILGLIHVADRRENRFTPRMIESLENAGIGLGLSLNRFQLQGTLSESIHDFEALSSHLLTVQEDEQQRIAMELHDQCGQDLCMLKIRLEDLRSRLPADSAGMIREFDQILAHTDRTIRGVRKIAHELKPLALEVIGFAEGSRTMIHEFSTYSKIQVNMNLDILDTLTNPMIQVCLFRIFQEALTNIYKHARADRVSIEADQEGDTILITIEDNGKGFDIDRETNENPIHEGMGLAAMKLRCRMVGAKLSIDSEPDRGTRIHIRLPRPES